MPSKKQKSARSSIFGCLVASTGGAYFNGLRRANDGFLQAIIRYSRFKEIHIFAPIALLPDLKLSWAGYLELYGSGKAIHFIPAHELSKYFSRVKYQVFHQGDPWVGHLSALRDGYCLEPFPITGRAHTLSTDSHLSRTRDLLLSPLKSCDAILCSSKAQKKVMKRLLSAASSSIADHIGVAISYKGSILRLPLGIEPDECFSGSAEEARELLGCQKDQFVILTLGRISPADKMDLHPALLVLNELVEGYGHRNIKWVIAGAGDAASPAVQSLLKQAYELNLEGCLRFELEIDDERKHQWLASSDLVLSLSDNIQESFGLVPLEAMVNGKAVVLSNWNGYSELVEEGVSGYLIETMSSDMDHLARPLGSLLTEHAHLLQSQGTAVDLSQCARVVHQLIQEPELREKIGEQGRQRVLQHYQWETIVDEYHTLVDTLNKEAAKIARLANRPVGLPYHQVFEHYPSQQLGEKDCFQTTDRGIRMLIRSEQCYHYPEMSSFLKADLIDQLAKLCLSGCTVAQLQTQLSDEPTLLLTIIWMCKYQLLERTDEKASAKTQNQHRWWPEEQRLPSEIMSQLSRAEFRRFRLLEPMLFWLDKQMVHYHNQPENLELRSSLLTSFASKMDGQLLQAIGWIGEQKDSLQYADILEYIIEQGGLKFLSAKFPLWYRLNRLRIVHVLKDFKKIFARFDRDISEINQLFSDCWDEPAQAIAGLHFPLSASSAVIAILECDNGQKLVYKNRDLNIEHQIIGFTDDNSNIAGKINQWLEGLPGLAPVRILPRYFEGAYGFCEFVDSNDDEILDDNQAQDYFQRLGVISGVSILLGLGDLHNRNIVSSKGIPYIIDAKVAFSPGVIRAFEAELNDPLRAFSGDDNSFQKTGLASVWEQFHFNGYKECLFQLVNGELIQSPPVEENLVANNWLHIGQRHSLDGVKPFLASEYANAVEKGIISVFRAVLTHSDQWCELLQECKGMSVCYLQRYNRQFFWKQKVDLWTFYGFQEFSNRRLKAYFTRMMNRLCQGGEEIQRWIEPQWQEPTALLSDELVGGLLSGAITEFRRKVGGGAVFKEHDQIQSGKMVADDYFAVDTLNKSIQLLENMAEDSEKMEQFLTFLTAIVKQWLLEKMVPGKEFPEALRERLPD
ncbi:DUF4135 domain-containing protein [Endozoicomonas sp.]|uniref:DUF4135 domain-containing protein n=1 Tax=Endozoicomonas sp. TaxID=1892382 RepID=UPI002884B9F3|nr:DUF4135 domain-containing protein [Endozoicomonas sp.]